MFLPQRVVEQTFYAALCEHIHVCLARAYMVSSWTLLLGFNTLPMSLIGQCKISKGGEEEVNAN